VEWAGGRPLQPRESGESGKQGHEALGIEETNPTCPLESTTGKASIQNSQARSQEGSTQW
jgi:hypothetical protein